uniref:Clathrin heavy chain linker domain containing 1 n=1 Tax=Erpetoichthys calabaricus TaxID=27687 RepID=A0A8C4T281_ERPCA
GIRQMSTAWPLVDIVLGVLPKEFVSSDQGIFYLMLTESIKLSCLSINVIEQATTYKRILTCIKQEYDDCIRALKEGGRDERFSHGKMRATAAEPTTLMNYKQRAAELQKRLGRTFNAVVKGKHFLIHGLLLVCNIFDPQCQLCFKMFTLKTKTCINSNMAVHIHYNLHLLNLIGAIVEESNLPPLLLFFKSVMRCEASDTHTPNEEICLEAVMVALKYNQLELVEQWITQQRLIITEALTDQIYKYGENNPEVTHTCLTLAQEAYRCCKVNKKAVLCMCKRGRVYEAVRYIHQCKAFSQDFLYLVQHCHSAEVLHSLTQKLDGKQAPMSLGCMVLSLMSENKWNCCLQLLKEFSAFGKDTLEQAILADELCTPEGWIEIARKCQEHNWGQLAHEIISILSAQGGVVDLSVCSDDAILMEHVFL